MKKDKLKTYTLNNNKKVIGLLSNVKQNEIVVKNIIAMDSI